MDISASDMDRGFDGIYCGERVCMGDDAFVFRYIYIPLDAGVIGAVDSALSAVIYGQTVF